MSSITECCSPCSTVLPTQIPGIDGPAGADGANGNNGVSAFTIVSADFEVPLVGANVTVTVGNSTWMTPGQNVFIQGAGYFEVVSKPTTTSVILTYLDYAFNTFTGNTISAGAGVSPSGATPSLSAPLPTALTDNSTGVATNIIAPGTGYQIVAIPRTFTGGTGAFEPVTDLVIGFKFKIVSWSFITQVALVGAGGIRVANMEINSTDVGTVPSTLTVLIAAATVGTVTYGTAIVGANVGSATDTFSIEFAAGGTQFTAGAGMFMLVVQNMDTADTVASLADHVNDLIVALT